jgi:hypothetical protein
MSLGLWGGIDELLTPAMGWNAPSSAYPLSTHIRGLVGHLALGAATAVTAETLGVLEE